MFNTDLTRRFALFYLVLACTVMPRCNQRGPTEPGGPVALPTETLFASSTSGVQAARTEVVRTEERLQAVWAELHAGRSPVPAVPSVDFARESVLVAAAGRTPESCLSISITSVRAVDEAAAVTVAERRLPSTCSCPPIIASPAHAVKVPRALGARVSFATERIVAGSCS